MTKFKSFKTAAIILALSTTGIANAEIFSYDTTFGGAQTRLTIDTQLGTATYVGGGTNVTFSGADFSNFTSNDTNQLFFFTGAQGVVNDRGRIFTPIVDADSGEARLRFRNNGQSEIWSAALNEDGVRRNFDIDSAPLVLVPNVPAPPPSSTGGVTSTGGNTSTGGVTGPTGGGTDVPAPGILGLLGLGLAGLAFGRRRKSIK